jgi:hypothetical protein
MLRRAAGQTGLVMCLDAELARLEPRALATISTRGSPTTTFRAAHRENPIFHQVPELSLLDGLRAVHLKLWDQDRGKLVSFADARQPRRRGRQVTDLSGIAEVDV